MVGCLRWRVCSFFVACGTHAARVMWWLANVGAAAASLRLRLWRWRWRGERASARVCGERPVSLSPRPDSARVCESDTESCCWLRQWRQGEPLGCCGCVVLLLSPEGLGLGLLGSSLRTGHIVSCGAVHEPGLWAAVSEQRVGLTGLIPGFDPFVSAAASESESESGRERES